jgi:acyl-CoA reductase-like NAD-dependent aldehyde dehydrogenase
VVDPSTGEVPPSVDQLRFFAGAARVLEGRSAGEYLRDHTSMIRREPVGVCAQVTPWNYPLMMAVWKIGPALAAGNTVVLKPSETTPVSTLLLAEIAAEFFPPGVFNVICGDRGTGRAMVVHPAPAMVSITGGLDVPDADFGPLNNPGQLARVSGFLNRVPAHAAVAAGGHALAGPGFLFEPTVVSGLAQDDEMVQDEIFGPVITVQRFSSEDEAVRLANGVRYGLGSSVWTRDHARALRMSRRLDFGVVWVNTHIPFIAEMPHGGFKHSGYGKDLSMYGFEDYTRVKHVMSYHG